MGFLVKIAVLISGGVDSSVALNILKDQGHQITAFYLKIWLEEGFGDFGDTCPWEQDLVYVREVCQRAGVPLFVVPLQQEYWESVVAYTLKEVKEGRTPNPDIFCNKLIKFGVFLDKFGDQFDKVATGHYAQIVELESEGWEKLEGELACEQGGEKIYELRCAPDEIKDQTYFLSYLDQKQLSKLIFPIGNLNKAQVRELAQKYDLPNKDRKDSQGICFLGKFKFEDFLKYYVGVKKGDLVEFETGKKLGEHEGFWFHTIGQRRGSGLSGGPWYVVEKDVAKNIVYLSKNYYSQEKVRDTFEVENVNWISGFAPENRQLQVKMRHGKNRVNCEVFTHENYMSLSLAGMPAEAMRRRVSILDNGNLVVKLENSDQGIAPGQFAVFYRSVDLSAVLRQAQDERGAKEDEDNICLGVLRQAQGERGENKCEGDICLGGGVIKGPIIFKN